MAIVELDLPEAFTFSTELSVRISEINYGNHVGNDRMVSLLHEARLRFLQSHGLNEFNISGVGLIVTDLVVKFKSEAFVGDLLKIEVGVTDFNKYGCDFIYRVTNAEDERTVTLAKTGVVFFDYDERKVTAVPKAFAALFESGE